MYSKKEQSWKQIGADLDVEFMVEFIEKEHSNSMISLSEDGSTIAIGSPGGAGSVRMYKNDNSTWVQMGVDIVGEEFRDGLGTSVSLSTDGKTVAIGAPYTPSDDDGYYTSGQVRVFTYDDATDAWEQKGEDINGEEMFFYSGQSVSLSANGNTVAIGYIGGMQKYYDQGFVRVYDFDADTGGWGQRGEVLGGASGSSVSLSADGNTIAIAALYLNRFNGYDYNYYNGAVRVHSYSGDTGSWEQKGEDINDENEYDLSGYPVSLSADGSTIAIGSRFTPLDNKKNSALVRVYSYDDDTDGWEQRGRDIKEVELENSVQQTVSLSADGSIVAVGYPSSNEVRAYVNKDGDTWKQLGDSIKGQNEGQTVGNAVSLVENNGKVTLAVGSFNKYTSVYEITVVSVFMLMLFYVFQTMHLF